MSIREFRYGPFYHSTQACDRMPPRTTRTGVGPNGQPDASRNMTSGKLHRRVAFLLAVAIGFSVGMIGLAAQDLKLLSDNPKPTQAPPKAGLQTRDRPIQVEVNLVLVNATVTDPLNRLVTGLDKEHFRVFENDKEQKILHFSSEDAPISIGLVFDASGSMSDKIDKSRQAVIQFFLTANPQDEFFLVDFNDQPRLICDYTTSIEEIQNKLVFAEAKGRTSLLDALYLALNHMRHAKHQKKAILIISDGGDNHSRYTEGEIKELVKEADVQIYAIGIYSAYGSRATPEEVSGPYLLTSLAEATGGRQFQVDEVRELPNIAEKIGLELRTQYILGYMPQDGAKDGKWRKIKVKLNPPHGLPPLRVYAKTGYYAPSP
jgi:Ca-activated chloride channel family protein